MNNNTKKTWSPNLELQDAMDVSKSFFNKCESKKILTSNSYRLFQVYKTENNWPLDNLIEVSRFFKFSKNDVPENDRAREIILNLLSAVEKAHYHFDDKALIKNDPYIFSIPDILKSGQFKYGIVYHIESKSKNKSYTLLSAEWDLMDGQIKTLPWDKYSAIIPDNHEKLFDYDFWKKIKSMDSVGYFDIKDWKTRSKYQETINTEKEEFKYGKALNYDPLLKELYSSISFIEWSKTIKKWFIPKGCDYKEALSFLENQKKHLKKDD